jgi:RpiR family transcriptional regulator, carbohydrate utilization regulator
MSTAFSLIDTLRQSLGELNKAERRVAETVLQDIVSTTAMSIRELADLAGVSQPTVVRLARRMGATGFADFKMRLSRDFATGRMFVLSDSDAPPQDPPQDPASIANQVYEATAQALAYAFSQRDPEALAAAVAALDAAPRVLCLGVGGSSANMASEAENRLFRFGVAATSLIDPYRQVMAAAMCDPGDALLIFSVTGMPQCLVECARIAAQRGATVIAVTRLESPLAQESRILVGLEIPDNDRRLEIPNRSRYGQLYVLDCLATMIGMRRLTNAAPKLDNARRALLALHGPTAQQPIGD